jgi:hypothetical protein
MTSTGLGKGIELELIAAAVCVCSAFNRGRKIMSWRLLLPCEVSKGNWNKGKRFSLEVRLSREVLSSERQIAKQRHEEASKKPIALDKSQL